MRKKWKATAEVDMDASKIKTVEVYTNTEKKARKLAEQQLKRDGAFFVSLISIQEVPG